MPRERLISVVSSAINTAIELVSLSRHAGGRAVTFSPFCVPAWRSYSGQALGATMKAQFAHCETAISAMVAATLQIVRHSQVGIVRFPASPLFAKKAKGGGAMEDEEVMIEMGFPLSSLRLMHLCVSRAYQNWPGGDPFEQVAIEQLKQALYVALYSTLYEIDEI